MLPDVFNSSVPPLICNLATGFVVPIPTFPSLDIRTRSVARLDALPPVFVQKPIDVELCKPMPSSFLIEILPASKIPFMLELSTVEKPKYPCAYLPAINACLTDTNCKILV